MTTAAAESQTPAKAMSSEAAMDDEEQLVAENKDLRIRSCRDLIDREHLAKYLTYSQKFQIFIVIMVILDCLIVIIELLFDLGAIVENDCEREKDCPKPELNRTHPPEISCTVNHELTKCGYLDGKLRCVGEHTNVDVNPAEVLHIFGILVLSVFMAEIVVKLYALGLKFFHHKLEVFDAIVVIISFALDVSYSGNEDAWDGIGLLILLRLWRVARIANGIIISVKKKAEKEVEDAKKETNELKQKLEEAQEELTRLKGGDDDFQSVNL